MKQALACVLYIIFVGFSAWAKDDQNHDTSWMNDFIAESGYSVSRDTAVVKKDSVKNDSVKKEQITLLPGKTITKKDSAIKIDSTKKVNPPLLKGAAIIKKDSTVKIISIAKPPLKGKAILLKDSSNSIERITAERMYVAINRDAVFLENVAIKKVLVVFPPKILDSLSDVTFFSLIKLGDSLGYSSHISKVTRRANTQGSVETIIMEGIEGTIYVFNKKTASSSNNSIILLSVDHVRSGPGLDYGYKFPYGITIPTGKETAMEKFKRAFQSVRYLSESKKIIQNPKDSLEVKS
jgi:hypothetical protein